MDTHLPDFGWRRRFEKVLLVIGMRKSTELTMPIPESKARSFFYRWAGRKQNLNPMWKKLMKLVDLEEPTSFLDHLYLGYTQRECKSNESTIEEYKKMFESRISAEVTERLPGWDTCHAKTVDWSCDMEGRGKIL